MKSLIHLSNKKDSVLPAQFEDIRFPESFVRWVLQEFTKEGDVVFDPFAGYGTTLKVAEEMGRIGYGIECDKDKADYGRSALKNTSNLILGDSLKLTEYDIPSFDISLTSPLYMHSDQKNALRSNGGGYKEYLQDISHIYQQIKEKLKDGGKVLIEVSNVRRDGLVTTLAWDIARIVGEVLNFEGEIVLDWEEGYGHGYDHSYLLVFKK